MSLSGALSNAASGLAVAARGTQVVADNLANARTPGFVRRDLQISARGQGGGVRIDGIDRVINTELVASHRNANAARSDALVRTNFINRIENVIGLPGEPNSLSQALNDFQVSIVDASRRPDNIINLEHVAETAQELVNRIKNASDTVQSEATSAGRAIEQGAKELNRNLSQVAYLNRKISSLTSLGKSTAALKDRRQELVNSINKLVPINEVARDNGSIALFAAGGYGLLDGSVQAKFEFNAKRYSQPLTGSSTNPLGRLRINGDELTEAQLKFVGGGSIVANFEIAGDLTTEILDQLDTFAMELHNLFADPAVDTTLSAAQGSTSPNSPTGIFTDAQGRATLTNLSGLASRLELSSAISSNSGGDLWKLRDGLGATSEGHAGNPDLLIKLSDQFEKVNTALPGGAFQIDASIIGRLAEIESGVISKRLSSEREFANGSSSVEALSAVLLEDGVNTDAEIQKLITLGQSYAANARVIQAIDEMMEQILRW